MVSNTRPHAERSMEAWSPGDNPERDRTEAAARLVGNHEAVVKFCLRGVGKPGPRPVMRDCAMADEAMVHRAKRGVVRGR